ALGPAKASATAPKSPAYRLAIRIRLPNGRQTASEIVIALRGEDDPYQVLSWQDDLRRRKPPPPQREQGRSVWSGLKKVFAAWIAGVTAAIEAIMARLVPQRRILFVENDDGSFAAQPVTMGKGVVLPACSFRLVRGRAEPALLPEWQAALRGSRIEILMQPDQALFRAVDFPKAAADFLDGMIRAQIDRLTPWTAAEAVFGVTP